MTFGSEQIFFLMKPSTSTKKYNNIINCSKYLEKIKRAKNNKEKNLLIKKANNCVINAISEIAKNCLLGNIPIKNCDFQKLKSNKLLLYKLASKTPVTTRKRQIIQFGGNPFLRFLIQQALSHLITYKGKKIY